MTPRNWQISPAKRKPNQGGSLTPWPVQLQQMAQKAAAQRQRPQDPRDKGLKRP